MARRRAGPAVVREGRRKEEGGGRAEPGTASPQRGADPWGSAEEKEERDGGSSPSAAAALPGRPPLFLSQAPLSSLI